MSVAMSVVLMGVQKADLKAESMAVLWAVLMAAQKGVVKVVNWAGWTADWAAQRVVRMAVWTAARKEIHWADSKVVNWVCKQAARWVELTAVSTVARWGTCWAECWERQSESRSDI